MRMLSIVIPAFNEEKTIGPLIEKILAVPTETSGFRKEIIVVDDGSRDDTTREVSHFPDVRCITQKNQGKGSAVQRGIQDSRGEYVLVQDADLEYDPQDYPAMLAEVPLEGTVAVYGSRTLGQFRKCGWGSLPGKHPEQDLGPWVANVILSFWTLFLFQRWISDPLTGYKIYPTKILRQFKIRTHGFETDHELTAKLVRAGVPIVEVPVRYYPRSFEEGKKIRPRDGLTALWTLLKFRFIN